MNQKQQQSKRTTFSQLEKIYQTNENLFVNSSINSFNASFFEIHSSWYSNDWLPWSIVNMIFFLPLIIFWLPALLLSIVTNLNNKKKINIDARLKLGIASLILNIICLAFGLVLYIFIDILIGLNYHKQLATFLLK